jgi:hypothetical protein
MSGIQAQLAGSFKTARSLRTPGNLPVKLNSGYTEFTLPQLTDYELIVLE